MNEERYAKQHLFAPIGEKGQQLLQEKHVLVVGAGALGTSSAEQLVRAGIGNITIIDRDYVELSNLQRQQLFTEKDAKDRLPKAVAAKDRLQQLNSEVMITTHVADVQREELEKFVTGVDLILDGTDNFETRMLINDMSQKNQIPWIYGGCVGSHGLSCVILPGVTPCLNCLMEAVPLGGATCDTVGVISPAVQMVTAHQVVEALKVLVEDEKAINKGLITFDLWNHHYTNIKTSHAKKHDCPSCGDHPTYPYLLNDTKTKVAVLCGRNTVQIRPLNKKERNLNDLKQRLPQSKVKENPFLLTYEDERHRMVFFKDGRVLIHGTKDVAEARNLYHKILGS
ncbi:MoeB/ThiF family adenylyltransferase [Halobacillus sp. H74]|uniref:MoeB/ThiF family adenylyltransferase n=1 Tax=Halobacillus sp. H74 TaxID=3457436 RepID=UPI003FCE0367